MPPLKVPGLATSASPTCALPLMVGCALNAGCAAAETRSLGFELTGPVEPLELLAVTSTTIERLRSLWVSVYCGSVAPEIGVHDFAVWFVHRSHLYVNEVAPLT